MTNDELKEIEGRVVKWGLWLRGANARLGYPTATSIARLIERVKVFEQRRKGVKEKSLKREPEQPRTRRSCPECGKGFGGTLKKCRYCQHPVSETAGGVETLSMRPLKVGEIPSDVTSVEEAITRLPKWMQAHLKRSYLYGQPDRLAARELRIRRETYREEREAALEELGEALEQRFQCMVVAERKNVV